MSSAYPSSGLYPSQDLFPGSPAPLTVSASFSGSASARLAARPSGTFYAQLSIEAVGHAVVGSSFSSLLFESLAAVLAASPDGQYGSYLSTIGSLGDTVAQIVTDIGDPSDPTAQTSADLLDGEHYMPAFGILLDPDLCPTQFLPYCVAPETRILTDDLRWVEAGSISTGDGLLAFDEFAPNGHRHWRRTAAVRVLEVRQPSYRLTFDDGLTVVCSSDHQWLCPHTPGIGQRYPTRGRYDWVATESMPLGCRVRRLLDTWTVEDSWQAGYLAAAFDGEGHLVQRQHAEGFVTGLHFTQNDNPMLAEVRRGLEALGVGHVTYGKHSGSSCLRTDIRGRPEMMRLLGCLRPRRLLAKFDPGRLGACDGRDSLGFATLVAKEPVGIQSVVAITTTTGTYVAEGLASHNCGQFAGVQIPVGSDDAMARAAIRREAGFQRGTVASMRAAVLAAMTAPGTNPYLVIQERTGGGAGSVVNPNDASDYPYHMVIAMRSDQSGLPAGTYTSANTSYALIAAVEAVKPAGIQISFSVSDGYVWGTATNEWSADTFSWQAAQSTQP